MFNKKRFISIFLVLTAIIFGGCSNGKNNNEVSQLQEIVKNNQEDKFAVFDLPAQINGVVTSADGNILVVKNELDKQNLTTEDLAKRRAERQKMSPEERQALRAQEIANAKTEDVTIEIPVGAIIVKGSGKTDGSVEEATFSEIGEGKYISVWLNDGRPVAVKIKGTK